MVRRKIFDDIISHTIWQPCCFFLKTFKNLLWNGGTDRGETLQVWPPIDEEQKVHTYDVIGHMVWQPCSIYPKTFKIFFSGTAVQIEVKLHKWPPVHEEQKVHTYDVIGHLVWQPYWIYLKTYKITPLKRSPGESLQSLIALFLVLYILD